jgi:glycosyltransferase involved in cell wall biosynthesis
MDHELARRESGWSTDRHVVLYVGNLKESKGCLDLLNAVARSPQHATTVELIFVGDGESRHALEKAAVSLGVSDTVRFMGKQPHDRLWQFMNAADVLVLPSHAEGIPNVLLEAMACGCPVVASNVGGIPEIVEPVSGVLVPPNSPEQLLAALVEVLRRPRNSVQIRATMLNRSWTRSGESLAAVLDEAISSCRVSAAGIPIDIRGAR